MAMGNDQWKKFESFFISKLEDLLECKIYIVSTLVAIFHPFFFQIVNMLFCFKLIFSHN
jgi:hypothetical protein